MPKMAVKKRLRIDIRVFLMILLTWSLSCEAGLPPPIPGGPPTPFKPNTLNWVVPTQLSGMDIADGKNCLDGRNAPNKKKTREMKREMENHTNGLRLTIRSNLRTYSFMVNQYYGQNCKSKFCRMDDATNTPICGRAARKFQYSRGLSCIDGSKYRDAMKEPVPGVRGKGNGERVLAMQRYVEFGNFHYRRNCKRRLCRFIKEVTAYICTSNWIQPNFLLVAVLSTLFVVLWMD